MTIISVRMWLIVKFNERLKLLRTEMGITQNELGKIIGVGRTTVSEYESGKIVPKQDGLIKIAEYFNVSVDYLTGITDEEKQGKLLKTDLNIDIRLKETIRLLDIINKSNNPKLMYKNVRCHKEVLTPMQLELTKEVLKNALHLIEKICDSEI